MLRLEQGDIGKLAGVHRNTIMDFESETRTPRAATVAAIRAALETAGVIFIDGNGDGPGVRMAKTNP